MTGSYAQGVFSKRLQARGYKSDQIKQLFYKSISRAEQYSGPTATATNDHTTILFHLPFHPNYPHSYVCFVCVCVCVCVCVYCVCVCVCTYLNRILYSRIPYHHAIHAVEFVAPRFTHKSTPYAL